MRPTRYLTAITHMRDDPLTCPPSGLTGLVLCGGASRRLGRDKALVDVGGQLLVDRVVDRLRSVCDPVMLAVGGDPERLAGHGDATVCDEVAGEGPLAGILAGLTAAPTDAVAVCAVDHPYPDPGLLAALASLADGHDAAVCVVDGTAQPLHAVWNTTAASVLRHRLERGRRSVLGALAALDWVAADATVWARYDPSARFALDVDTVADLAAVDPSR